MTGKLDKAASGGSLRIGASRHEETRSNWCDTTGDMHVHAGPPSEEDKNNVNRVGFSGFIHICTWYARPPSRWGTHAASLGMP